MTTATRATKLAPRLRTLRDKRLGLVIARPGGSSKQTERSVSELLRRLAALVEQRHGVASVREWRKPTPRLRMDADVIDEIVAECDAVIMGIGDCHMGSACSLTNVWELEERGVPVAYVDTPRRVPRVERDGEVFVIDYFALERRVPRWKREGVEKLRGAFELQGINRALRLAGARPGARIRVDKVEFDLWAYPDATWMSSEGTDGVADYQYLLTEPLSRNDPMSNAARAEELVPRVVEAVLW